MMQHLKGQTKKRNALKPKFQGVLELLGRFEVSKLCVNLSRSIPIHPVANAF